jgi:hypothetical protein
LRPKSGESGSASRLRPIISPHGVQTPLRARFYTAKTRS